MPWNTSKRWPFDIAVDRTGRQASTEVAPSSREIAVAPWWRSRSRRRGARSYMRRPSTTRRTVQSSSRTAPGDGQFDDGEAEAETRRLERDGRSVLAGPVVPATRRRPLLAKPPSDALEHRLRRRPREEGVLAFAIGAGAPARWCWRLGATWNDISCNLCTTRFPWPVRDLRSERDYSAAPPPRPPALLRCCRVPRWKQHPAGTAGNPLRRRDEDRGDGRAIN